jgi:hypothetical protein
MFSVLAVKNPIPPIPFSPSDLPNLRFWLDAQETSTMTIDGGNRVSRWNSRVGSIFFDNATGTTQPLYNATGINSLPAVNFNPTKMLRSNLNNVMSSQNKNMFIVLLPTALSAPTTYIGVDDFNNTAHGIFSFTRFGTRYRNASNTTTIVRQVPISAQFTLTPAIVSCQVEGQSSNTVDEVLILINNDLGIAATTGNGVYVGPYTVARSILGAVNIAGASNLVGLIGEFIYYDGQLTSENIQDVRDYLAAKWSIPL